ncbi:16S rRNA (cytosine(967)-C(5))-methyltransferase [Psychromonas sp. psych-6C06]|uniref:16S rRNA (cytosine(967)-C(5))-methyltransferase RsmB n=1 Tax=Psychromonas sp. psych-6C06 TaxID=2058089 RepID=UPI000C3323C4|nr:16S rRNA (cytosine(967)-C(5))-methyltransferase RsmB [Psychromonas sp. psych-6C06]PKF60780.1 16S rRNA (cytosine(967)-C(5))-methyltransferase [Psychromonas sp. psych-6C06]
MNIRALAAKVLNQVVEQGQSLSQALPSAQQDLNPKDKALLQMLCYGVLRTLPRIDFFCRSLMQKPLKGKQRELHFLILVGFYQLLYTRIPSHAAVGETVNGAKALKKQALKGMINGVLRNFLREQEGLIEKADQQDTLKYCHPSWLVKRLQQAYGEQQAATIMTENNQQAPMWLRVNQTHHNREQYQQLLSEATLPSIVASDTENSNALRLEKATDVYKLPGFTEGWVSVQDGAAQLAAHYLGAQADELILDACAAPGGKTVHALELQPAIKQMVAVDADANRLTRVEENLARLNLKATVIHGDASQPDTWWQGEQFDRILCDAPCSATGVIRRHPDIRWLRRDSDIAELVALQKSILSALWKKLKPGGVLLYATCSILPDENEQQVQRFLESQSDATLIPLSEQYNSVEHGRQLLPNEDAMDGFYYAKLQKAK